MQKLFNSHSNQNSFVPVLQMFILKLVCFSILYTLIPPILRSKSFIHYFPNVNSVKANVIQLDVLPAPHFATPWLPTPSEHKNTTLYFNKRLFEAITGSGTSKHALSLTKYVRLKIYPLEEIYQEIVNSWQNIDHA